MNKTDPCLRCGACCLASTCMFPDSVYQAVIRYGIHSNHFAPDTFLDVPSGAWIVQRAQGEPCPFLRKEEAEYACWLFNVPEFRAFYSNGCALDHQFKDVLKAYQEKHGKEHR